MACVAKAGAQGAEKMLCRQGADLDLSPPHDENAKDGQDRDGVKSVDGRRPRQGHDDAAERGANGARDIHAEAVQRDRLGQNGPVHELRHNGLEGWGAERGAQSHHRRQPQQ
ncbi:hypothetical protein D9M71_771950 [compost metagenome]